MTLSHSDEIRSALSVESDLVDGAVVVRLRGRLNWFATRGLLDVIEGRWSDGPAVIDLCGVDFLDAAGTGLLVRLVTDAGRGGRAVAVAATEPIAWVLQQVGLSDVVPCRTSVADALAALHLHDAGSAQPLA